MKRGRKPEISPEKAFEWLRRLEHGESMKNISVKDGNDERTVKKYIAQAQQDRENSQARTMVYKDALERHFKDLVSVAKKLDQAVSKGKSVGEDSKDPLYSALTEHQPNSKIWTSLSEWNDVLGKVDSLRKNLLKTIKERVAGDQSLEAAFWAGSINTENIAQAMMIVVDSIIGDYPGIRAIDSLKQEPTEDPTKVTVRYETFDIGILPRSHLPDLTKALTELENSLGDLELLKELKVITERKEALQEEIHKALTVIILRRVVSGNCEYCPF